MSAYSRPAMRSTTSSSTTTTNTVRMASSPMADKVPAGSVRITVDLTRREADELRWPRRRSDDGHHCVDRVRESARDKLHDAIDRAYRA
jgi:hypothetical protein